MTGQQLANKCLEIAKNYKTCYVWGGMGSPMTEPYMSDAISAYPTHNNRHIPNGVAKNAEWGFDCSGLIKAVIWGWKASKTRYGGAIYQANGFPDTNTEGMISQSKNVSSDFSKIKVGECVWKSGHIGIYVGNGLAVECTPSWSNGVQITAVANIGKKDGYNYTTWTKHGELKAVDYSEPVQPKVLDVTSVSYQTWKGGKIAIIPIAAIDRISHESANDKKGEYSSYAAKRIKWNNRFPEILSNAELFNMSTYKPASGIKEDGIILYNGWDYGIGFKDCKTLTWEGYSNPKAIDWVGGYPALVNEYKKLNFQTPSGLGGSAKRTAIGYNDNYLFIIWTKDGATLNEIADKFVQLGARYAINLDGGGSTSYVTPDEQYGQSRKLRGFICVWLKNGKGNKMAKNPVTQTSIQTTTTTTSTTSTNTNGSTLVKTGLLKDESAKYGKKFKVANCSALNLRNEKGAIIGVLNAGDTVMWYGYHYEAGYVREGEWYYVQYKDKVGYVSKKYLSLV